MEKIHEPPGNRYQNISGAKLATEVKDLSNTEVGRRLRVARESAAFTQAAAAREIKVARTTLVSIEQGRRRARIDDLQRLAALYRTSVNSILRRESVFPDIVPRFRRLKRGNDTASEEAVRILNGLVVAEIELENVLGINRAKPVFAHASVLSGDVRQRAEIDAQILRNSLGLGPGPIADIISLLDHQLGIRIYLRRIDPEISGLFVSEENIGACMLLNASHPAYCIRQSAAHHLGHFCLARASAGILTRSNTPNSREERYADHFARCFLAPAEEVKKRFVSVTAGQSHFTSCHAIILANESGVSHEVMVRRLEELSLVRTGTWNRFLSNGGITDERVRQVLGFLPGKQLNISLSGGLVPPRLALLAREAWKRDIYSEEQLARLLMLSRQETRGVLYNLETEREEADDSFRLSS